MPEDRPSRGERIDLNGPDVDRWAQRFGVSREELAKAVESAGDDAEQVADYLRQYGPPATSE